MPLVILYSYLFFMNNKSNSENFIRSLIIWCIIIFGVWLLYLFVLPHGLPYIKRLIPGLIDNDGGIGTFGDYFGALNTLFAGFAFAGIIISIRQQSADLQATKQEMRGQTQQFKLNRAADDIYRRFSLIRELEQAIEFTRYKQTDNTTTQGESALFDISRIINQLFIVLFPDEDDKSKSLTTNNIKYDCISVAITFAYLDAWLKTYRDLIEDMRDTDTDNREEKTKYLRVLLRATHGSKLSLIYVFHDTQTKYRDFDSLFENELLSKNDIFSSTQDKKKRELFHKLLLTLLDTFTINEGFEGCDEDIWSIANEWRTYKKWPKFLPLIKYEAQGTDISSIGYTRNLKDIIKDESFMKAFKEQTRETIHTTLDTINSPQRLTHITFPYCEKYYITSSTTK